MSTKNLKSYLQEHAAGASMAVDLLQHLISSHAGTPEENFYRGLLAEIIEDKGTLDEILARFDASESIVLNTMSRLTEKFARAKFLLAGPGHGDLGRLEAVEMVSLGIEGKHVLWLSLQAIGSRSLQDVDFERLLSRALSQRERVEIRRISAARGALAPE